MVLNFIIGILFIIAGIFLIFYTKKKPSGDFIFGDLKVYAIGFIFIIGGFFYILDKLKFI